MRIAIAIILFMLYKEASATAALWSGIRLLNDGVYTDNIGEYGFLGNVSNDEGNRADIISEFFAHKESDNLYLKHEDYSLESTEATFNWWAFAVYGDIVGEENFNALKHIEDFYGNDWYTGGTLVENPDDFYMVFKVSEVLLDEKYNYVPGQTWYGWVHASIDENLEMTLLGDGINLDGGSVTVGGGGTPEPASCPLLLVGGALLVLRRRRRALMP